jgi:hypothetical protein
MAEEIINITIDEIVENVNVVVNETIEDVTITIQEISKTSDLINDGEDGVHPFITAASIPPVNDATTTVKGVVKLAGDLAGTADAPTVPGLTNKVDKVTGSRLITSAEATILSNTSGVNSGDETASTIKTKLGITTLSGSNTGDQDLSGLVPYTGATANVNLGTNNLTANNFFDGFTSVIASANLITLTISSTPSYLVTGSGGQTIKMPVATTLPNGAMYYFNNNQSSGAILINNNSNTLIKSVPSGGNMILELIDNSTAAGSWDVHSQAPSNVSWSTNTFDYVGSITGATWNGVSVADNRIASSATWNAKEDGANKVTTFTGNETSTTKFPVVKAILDYFSATNIKSILGITTLSGSNTGDQDLSGLVVKNTAITGATKTKITYDSKGLVTAGSDATTADIADSTNKRYQTDNQNSFNDATSSIQTQLNAKQNTLGYTPYRYINTSSSSVTGTTTETIMATATINGNVFNANDIMKILYEVNKTTILVAPTLRIRINTTNTLTGSTVIATYTMPAANTFALMQRNFVLSSSNLVGYSFTTTALTDISTAVLSSNSTAYNTANTLYLFFTIQLGNTGDIAFFTMGNITN